MTTMKLWKSHLSCTSHEANQEEEVDYEEILLSLFPMHPHSINLSVLLAYPIVSSGRGRQPCLYNNTKLFESVFLQLYSTSTLLVMI